MSFLYDQNNKLSMMRIGFTVTLIIGSIVSLSGVIAMFMALEHAGTAITSGVAVIGSGGFAKAVQAKWEANNV